MKTSIKTSRYPSLSVIIPAYNAAATIGKQLDALKDQTYKGDWEVIVVNNRSTDETVEIAQNYQDQMPHLSIINAPDKQNKSYTRNTGAVAAKGDMFVFCDADDVADSDWLMEIAKACKNQDLIAGAVDVDRLNDNAVYRPTEFFKKHYPKKPALDFLPFVSSCNMTISRRAFNKVGGFSEEFLSCHDVEISWRLQLQGFSIHYVPTAIMYRRHRETLQQLWKQVTTYSYFYPLLYQQYASSGMPRSSTKKVWERYKWILKTAFRLPRISEKRQALWVYQAAVAWGRLRGSMRYKTLYL